MNIKTNNNEDRRDDHNKGGGGGGGGGEGKLAARTAKKLVCNIIKFLNQPINPKSSNECFTARKMRISLFLLFSLSLSLDKTCGRGPPTPPPPPPPPPPPSPPRQNRQDLTVLFFLGTPHFTFYIQKLFLPEVRERSCDLSTSSRFSLYTHSIRGFDFKVHLRFQPPIFLLKFHQKL